MTVNLSRVRAILNEAQVLVDELDGLELDDSRSYMDQSKGNARQERAKRTQELQLLATRFELAAALVRVEFWYVKGESDPLEPRRRHNE